MSNPRIYLTGHVALECRDRVVGEDAFPGRQGLLAFVFLTMNRRRPVGRDELIDVIWPDQPPPSVDAALNAIVSKLRSVLRVFGDTASESSIDVRSGRIGIRLPASAWVDVEEAACAIDEAEGAVRTGDWARAWGFANVVVSIADRPFVPDCEAGWIHGYRTILRTLLVRGLECLAAASHATGQPTLAMQHASELLRIEPFRETGYQHLMRAHASVGNNAEALRVYDRCRTLLREELGTSPSPQTEAVFLRILRASE